MPIAVIKTGGKQYKVNEGEILEVELLYEEQGKKLEFKDILDNKNVSASIVEELVKGPKIRICKYKNKVRYRRTTGHRQKFTKIKIEKIS